VPRRAALSAMFVAVALTACSESPTSPRNGVSPVDGPSAFTRNVSLGLQITVTAIDFGEVRLNTTSPEEIVSVTNLDAAPVTLSGSVGVPTGPFTASQDCQGTTLGTGQSCHMRFSFAPSAAGTVTATASGSWNGQAFSIALRGAGSTSPLFQIAATAFDFGQVPVGATSPAQSVRVTNLSAASVVMSGTAGAPGGGFVVTQNCQGHTLAPGAFCTMTYEFHPTTVGAATATSSGSWNGQAYSISLAGTGANPTLFHITPTGLDFGDIAQGTVSAPDTVVITNISGATITMNGAGGNPGGSFSGAQSCQGLALPPGGHCYLIYNLIGTTAGPATATSAGTWNGQPFNIALKGNVVGPHFLISPTALDFGEVPVGSVSRTDSVTVTNVGLGPVTMNGAGGNPGGSFTGAQSCQGLTLPVGGKCYLIYNFIPSATGPATATSAGTWTGAPFSVTLNGTGIPTGSSPTALFLVSPTALDFGDVQVGTVSRTDSVLITNVSAASITMNGAGGNPGGSFTGAQSCQGLSLPPGGKCYLIYNFLPTATGPATATSAGTWNGQPFSVSLKGNGALPRIRVSASALDFGEVMVGTASPAESVTVTNIDTHPVTMNGAGGNPGGSFTGAQSCQGLTLPPGGKCYLIYNFLPSAAGPATATSAGTWTGAPFNVTLNGVGVGPAFRISPTGLDFGEVAVGTASKPDSVTITNISAGPVTMNGAGGNPGGSFAGAQSCQGLTLQPGGTCYLIYNFLPTASGPATGTSAGTWNGVPFNVSLKGSGGGSGPLLRISPVGFDFGTVALGTSSASQMTTVTNVGLGPVVLSGTSVAPGAGFTASDNCQNTKLNPGQSCQMSFGFTPTTLGAATATATGTWSGQAYSIALHATGGFAVSGFFRPLGPYPGFQRVTAGSAVPLAFSVGGDQGLDILAAGSPTSGPVSCRAGSVNVTESSSTAGQSGLQYDPDTDTYTYPWKTDRAWRGSCRSLTMRLVDGSVLRANFNFR
jgi:hypothetical protein